MDDGLQRRAEFGARAENTTASDNHHVSAIVIAVTQRGFFLPQPRAPGYCRRMIGVPEKASERLVAQQRA